jgi:hypothetical protein
VVISLFVGVLETEWGFIIKFCKVRFVAPSSLPFRSILQVCTPWALFRLLEHIEYCLYIVQFQMFCGVVLQTNFEMGVALPAFNLVLNHPIVSYAV